MTLDLFYCLIVSHIDVNYTFPRLQLLNMLEEIGIYEKDQHYFCLENMHYRHDFYEELIFELSHQSMMDFCHQRLWFHGDVIRYILNSLIK